MDRSVVVVGYEGAELLDIACVTTTPSMASTVGAPAQPYAVSVASPGRHDIRCGTGLALGARGALEGTRGPLDTLVVSGGIARDRAAEDPVLVGHVRRLTRESRRVARCARGRPCSRPPGCSTVVGRRPTGSSQLVTDLQRPRSQAQVSLFTAAPAPDHDAVPRVLDHVHPDLAADLDTPALAAVAGLSPRRPRSLSSLRLPRTHGGRPVTAARALRPFPAGAS